MLHSGKRDRTLREVSNALWKLEEDLGLLDLSIGKVKVWQALRVEHVQTILGKLELHGTAQEVAPSTLSRLKHAPRVLHSALGNNPFLDDKKSDALVFDHPRKVLLDNQYIDPYTHGLIQELEAAGSSVTIYERPYRGRHWSGAVGNRKHLDFIQAIAVAKQQLFPTRFLGPELLAVKELEDRLLTDIGVQMNLVKRYRRYVTRFLSEYSLYQRLLQRKSPATIYVVICNAYPALIKAARDIGVRVVELQHGLISEYHFAYSYPSSKIGSLEYYPDELWIWDEFWSRMAPLPLHPDNIVVYPYWFMEHQLARNRDVPKYEKRLSVISQGSIGEQLASYVLAQLPSLASKGYEIVYKLHPGEYDRWRNYPAMDALAKSPSVRIIANGRTKLYEMLASSNHVLGVYSTTLVEASALGCQIYVVDLPGSEHLHKFTAVGMAHLVQSSNSLVSYLESPLGVN